MMSNHTFDPVAFLRSNFADGPVAFFREGKFASTAEHNATELYRSVVSSFVSITSDVDLQRWSERVISSDFLILETSDVRAFWDGLAVKESSRKRAVGEIVMHNVYADQYARDLTASSSPSPQKTPKRPRITVEATNVQYQAESTDNIMLTGLVHSVGYEIKNAAATKYSSYHECTFDEKTLVALGLNSIIDVDNTKSKSQRTLFSDQQWEELLETFPVPTLPQHQLANPSGYTKSLLEEIKKHLIASNFSAAIYMANKSEYKSKSSDEATMFNVVSLHVHLWKYQAYLFDPKSPTLSEADYIVKVWGPLLESIFRDSAALRCAWGETHCIAAKEPSCSKEEQAVMRTDLRIVNGNDEYATGEFCKAIPRESKVSTDRTKLLIEGKFVLNKLVNVGIKTVYLLHVAALELRVVALTLVADGLYVAHTVDSFNIPTSKKAFTDMITIIHKLLSLKNVIAELHENDANSQMQDRVNTQGLSRSTMDRKKPDGATLISWARQAWVQPHDYSLPVPPSSFIATPIT